MRARGRMIALACVICVILAIAVSAVMQQGPSVSSDDAVAKQTDSSVQVAARKGMEHFRTTDIAAP